MALQCRGNVLNVKHLARAVHTHYYFLEFSAVILQMKDLRSGEADFYLARKLPVSRPMSFSLTPRVEFFLLLMLPMPSQPKPAHLAQSPRTLADAEGAETFSKISGTRLSLEISWGCWMSPVEALVSTRASPSLYWLPICFHTIMRLAWLERDWLRGVGHTWNTYQDLSGGRIGKKVVKIGDAFKKRSYGAFYLILQISRNLAYNGYLFWPFSVFPFSVLYQN